MPSLRSGRLYPRFIALFLLMVVFSSIILAGVTGYFSLKNEDALYTRIEENTETVTKRLSSDILTLFDLCGLVAENSIIQENFRPYEVLKLNQKYYSNDIVDLLWQCRLQFSGLIESVFLYADSERVLYSANENGMASGDTFFSRIMLYEKMKKEDYARIFLESHPGFFEGKELKDFPEGRVCEEMFLPLEQYDESVSCRLTVIPQFMLVIRMR